MKKIFSSPLLIVLFLLFLWWLAKKIYGFIVDAKKDAQEEKSTTKSTDTSETHNDLEDEDFA